MAKITSIVILFFCILNLSAAEVDKKLHNECLYPTILVAHYDNEYFGSGVVVRSEKVKNDLYKNVFLSCGHITSLSKNDYTVYYYLYENWSKVKEIKKYSATFYAINIDSDISVGVFYSDREIPTAKVEFNEQLFIGTEVFRIGCGLGDDPRLDIGKITGFKKNLRTSIHTLPGDSGSPVFYNYKVIAIMVKISTSHNTPVFGTSYAVPVQKFKDWNVKLDFAWDHSKKIPELPFQYLNFKNNYEEIKK